MEKNKVRSGAGLSKVLLCSLLGTLLVVGCRTSRNPDTAGVPDITELPGTPLGVPGGQQSAAVGTVPAPEPVPAAVTQAPASSSKVTTTASVGGVSDADSSGEVIRVGETLDIVYSDTTTPLQPAHEKVRDDGTITLMWDKTFKAAGKTPGDLAKEIRATYVPDYYTQLTVSINRAEILRTIFVDGEVRIPSKQAYTGPITVTQVIASAGGFTDFADRRHVRVVRTNGKIDVVDCKKALKNPKLDLEVFPGDKVHVPRSNPFSF